MSMRRPYLVDPSVSGMSGAVKTNEMIEEENDRMVDQMAHKVATLKTLSIDISDEVKGQNRMLGDMGEDFDSAGGLLGGSMKRLKGMAKAGHNRWMLYMILFIVAVFFVVYYIIQWRRT